MTDTGIKRLIVVSLVLATGIAGYIAATSGREEYKEVDGISIRKLNGRECIVISVNWLAKTDEISTIDLANPTKRYYLISELNVRLLGEQVLARLQEETGETQGSKEP